MDKDEKNVRVELRRILGQIKAAPNGNLDWVSASAGVPMAKVAAFMGNDMSEPDDAALSNIEAHFLLDWYYFPGPT